jgi:hypothetical protein
MPREACHGDAVMTCLAVFSSHSLALIAVIVLLPAATALCQDEAASGQQRDIGMEGLRHSVERQSALIDELTREVARLAAIIEKDRGPAALPVPAQATSPAEEEQPQGTDIHKTETAGTVQPGETHVVSKGETLTSIARHYKIGVAELLQANKIVDDRKLQIGQTLVIPAKTENTEPTPKPAGGN